MIDVTLTGVYVAGPGSYWPNLADPTKSQALFTAMDNSGPVGSAPNEVTISAWGKLADTCCQYLPKGKRVNLRGRMDTFRREDGQAPDGSKRWDKRTTIHLYPNGLELLADPAKIINQVLATNGAALAHQGKLQIQAMETAGKLPPGVAALIYPIIDALFSPQFMNVKVILGQAKAPKVDFNPALITAEGLFGHFTVRTRTAAGSEGAAAAMPVGNFQDMFAASMATMAASGAPMPAATPIAAAVVAAIPADAPIPLTATPLPAVAPVVAAAPLVAAPVVGAPVLLPATTPIVAAAPAPGIIPAGLPAIDPAFLPTGPIPGAADVVVPF